MGTVGTNYFAISNLNMIKFTNLIGKASRKGTVWNVTGLNKLLSSSSQSAPELKEVNKELNMGMESNFKFKNRMVAAAFASLQDNINADNIKTPSTDERLNQAKTVDEILSISSGIGISRQYALKVVSVLAEWTSSGKIKIPDFETDPRFIKLCRVLTAGKVGGYMKTTFSTRSEDLSTVLSVTADDEAAKLIGSITLSQMVKVMSTLAQKKRRSVLLLRSLAFNITGCPEKLDLKQSADLLFGMATLNFYDSNLLDRVCTDICTEIKSHEKRTAVVRSILTSLGILRYKDLSVLDILGEWILRNSKDCCPQDLFALFHTYAVLNYQQPPFREELKAKLLPQLNHQDASNDSVWLDYVWSLVLLNLANSDHIAGVLAEDFVGKFKDNVAAKLKLLNIDAYVRYFMPDYNGRRLSTEIKKMEFGRTKEKEEMVASVVDSLKNLMSTETYLKCNVNTEMGFFIDAECILDKKFNLLPLNKATNLEDYIRLAIIVHDYHDLCRGKVEPTGTNDLAMKLLQAQKYKLLIVPYSDFRPRDKLIQRVQYLETKLKEMKSTS